MITLKTILKGLRIPHLLLALSLIGIAVNFLFPYSDFIHFSVVMIFVIFYVIFSILHHYLDKTLTAEIMIEYILLATLAIVIILRIQI
jgi:hypothetical protein